MIEEDNRVYPYDWNAMPVLLAEKRKNLVGELIVTDDPMKTVRIRAQIHLLDELIRLPKTAHEEREFAASTRGNESDD